MKISVRRREIAKYGGYAQRAGVAHHFAAGALNAFEAGLAFAGSGAAVTVERVRVVALLVDEQAVTAVRGARSAAAVRLGLASRRTTVERDRIAVVTAFGAFSLAVTAFVALKK